MENDQSQDKIAQASYKKIQEARKKGHIPRSRDFSSFAVLFCGFLCLIFYFYFNQDFYKLANFNFQIDRASLFDNTGMINHLKFSLFFIAKSIVPYFLILLIVVFLANLIPGGFSFSFDSMKFKLERVSITKGLIKMFSFKSILEILILFVKISFILASTYGLYVFFRSYVFELSYGEVNSSILYAIYYILITIFWLSITVLIISFFDMPYRIYSYNKQLEMSHQEIKDEQKNTEGNSDIKRARNKKYNQI